MSGEKIQKLCRYLEANQVKNFPIGNEQLKKEEEHVQSSYFRMLAVVLQAGEMEKEQVLLFRRLVESFAGDMTAEDYMRQALEIEIKEYEDFVAAFLENPLKYRFALDAILLAGLGEKREEQLTLIARMLESLKINKNDADYLTALGVAILEQDAERYGAAQSVCPPAIDVDLFLEYLRPFAKVIRVDREDLLCIRSLGTDPAEAKGKWVTGNHRKVVLENLRFENFAGWGNENNTLCKCDEVLVKHCTFTNGKTAVCFNDCKSVTFTDCRFENFSWRVVMKKKADHFTLKGCAFENCVMKYSRGNNDWASLGGVIWGEGQKEMDSIENCVFRYCGYCGGKNSEDYYSTAFISNANSMVKNCEFIGCWHYKGGSIDPNDDCEYMFTSGSVAVKNRYVNSARFNL